MARVLI